MRGGECDYVSGQEALYREGGEVFGVKVLKVEVLQNNSDRDHERYFLRVLKVPQNTNESRTLEIGDEFECKKPKNIPEDFPISFSFGNYSIKEQIED